MKKRPKIGLVLGSGGAKGLTQIGIVKTLIENNIPIDYIAGVSIGSVIGAYYSLYGNVEGLEQAIMKLSKRDVLKMIDFNSPKEGVEGKKTVDFLIRLLGDKRFSDLQVPMKIVATCLENGEEIKFDSGKLHDAIRASISIPGFFKPIKMGEKHYLDGGIVNPTPIDVVREMGAEVIIAVDHTMSDYSKIKDLSAKEVLKRSFEITRTNITRLKMGKVDKNVILISVAKKTLKDTYDFSNKRFISEGIEIGKNNISRIKKAIEEFS